MLAQPSLKLNLARQLGGLLGVRWMGTLDYKVGLLRPGRSIRSMPQCRGQQVFLFWHEYILFPLYLRGIATCRCC